MVRSRHRRPVYARRDAARGQGSYTEHVHLPVPERLAVWGLVIALSATSSTATRVPFAVGVNVILTVQFALAASVVPQVVADWAKSPAFAPVNVMPEIVRVVLRLFLTVIFFAVLVVPTVWAVKVKLDGVTDTGAIPVPVKLTDCGLLFALSVTVSDAVFAPGVTGAKVTPILQDEWAPMLAPQALEDTANSPEFVPVVAMLDRGKAALVLFVSVTVLGAVVVPSASFPKASVTGDKEACRTPVPESAIVCGLFAALSRRMRAADLAPKAVGVKAMLIVQELFSASELPQVVADWAKSVGSVPLIAIEDIVTTAPVLLVIVTFLAALVLAIP